MLNLQLEQNEKKGPPLRKKDGVRARERERYLLGSSSVESKADFMRFSRNKGLLEKYPPYFEISTRNCTSKTNCSRKHKQNYIY